MKTPQDRRPLDLRQPLTVPIRPLRWGRPRYRVASDWQYKWLAKGSIWRIRIRRGYECDGASVPRILWTLTGITPDGLHRAAALVHDRLYENRGCLPPEDFQRFTEGQWKDVPDCPKWTRKQCDELFARILAECGESRLKRRLMYLGVRLGGWWAWWGDDIKRWFQRRILR